MATYSGFAQRDYLVTNDDDSFLNLSINTRSASFAFDSDEAQIIPEWVFSDSVSITNISYDTENRTGVIWGTYSDIFYNRIWIIPPTIDLTGAPSTFSTTVSVWNSYFVQKNMTTVTPTNISGINFNPSVPDTFDSLEIKNYNLALTSGAPASINGNYQFIFSDAEDPYLLISGVLAVAFPYFHNWDQGNSMIERLSYLTDIIESHSGKEQRIRLRKYPRRSLEYDILITESNDFSRNSINRALFNNQMFFGRSKTWIVPMVQDYRYLGYDVPSGTSTININTQYHDYFDNGYVMLYDKFDNYEVVRVSSMTSSSITLVAPTAKDHTSSTTIVPMRQAVFGDEASSGNIINYGIEDHSVSWSILVQSNAQTRTTTYVPTYTYRGYDVYMEKSDFADEGSNIKEIYNPQRPLDNNTGIFSIDPRFDNTKERTDLNLLLKSKQEISEFLGFAEYRTGKLNPMWTPTFANDIQIVQSGSSGDTTITINNIGYSLFVKENNIRRDVVFVKSDGTPLFRRIEGSMDNGDGTETITLDSSLGFDFSISDFQYISFLRFVRLDSDDIEINYLTTDSAKVSLKLVDLFDQI